MSRCLWPAMDLVGAWGGQAPGSDTISSSWRRHCAEDGLRPFENGATSGLLTKRGDADISFCYRGRADLIKFKR